MDTVALALAGILAAPQPIAPVPHSAPAAVTSPRTAPRGTGDAPRSAQDEFDLGQLHYARGEYRQAADAFARASARLEPTRKPEARYWSGLSWLGAGDPVQARSAFEDVIATPSARRSLAQLGLAQSWELAGRSDRAYATLASLVGENAMEEAAATALARYSVLAGARAEAEVARRARERLLREQPASMEAAAEHLEAGAPGDLRGRGGPPRVAVQIGAFAEVARARALADAARRAGFEHVAVIERPQRGGRLWMVAIGSFARTEDAHRVAARAAERLGVNARIVSPP